MGLIKAKQINKTINWSILPAGDCQNDHKYIYRAMTSILTFHYDHKYSLVSSICNGNVKTCPHSWLIKLRTNDDVRPMMWVFGHMTSISLEFAETLMLQISLFREKLKEKDAKINSLATKSNNNENTE